MSIAGTLNGGVFGTPDPAIMPEPCRPAALALAVAAERREATIHAVSKARGELADAPLRYARDLQSAARNDGDLSAVVDGTAAAQAAVTAAEKAHAAMHEETWTRWYEFEALLRQHEAEFLATVTGLTEAATAELAEARRAAAAAAERLADDAGPLAWWVGTSETHNPNSAIPRLPANPGRAAAMPADLLARLAKVRDEQSAKAEQEARWREQQEASKRANPPWPVQRRRGDR